MRHSGLMARIFHVNSDWGLADGATVAVSRFNNNQIGCETSAARGTIWLNARLPARVRSPPWGCDTACDAMFSCARIHCLWHRASLDTAKKGGGLRFGA